MTDPIKLIVWGREFVLPVDFDCFEDEEPTEQQKSAFDKFVSHPEWIEQAKSIVAEWCKKQVLEDDENTKKDNVFSYVKPDYLFVKNGEKDTQVSLMCKYRYDPEHGLAVVFSSEGKVTVGIQDIIL